MAARHLLPPTSIAAMRCGSMLAGRTSFPRPWCLAPAGKKRQGGDDNSKNPGEFELKSVFITGAARGIGLAIARVFAEKGWRVGLYDKNDETFHELLNTPPFAGNSVAGHIDVTQAASVRSALEAFMAASGGRPNLPRS